MRKLILLVIFGVIAWQVYAKLQLSPNTSTASAAVEGEEAPAMNSSYSCDGRTHCSQMTSCEEATWFIQNCPDTKMDGNNDGIPCEKQWCK